MKNPKALFSTIILATIWASCKIEKPAPPLHPQIQTEGRARAERIRKEMQRRQPIFDQNIGFSEEEVLARYGKPGQSIIKPAKEYGGELHNFVREKFLSEPGRPIKALTYQDSEENVRIFWLKRKWKKWVIFSDVFIPKGVQF
jgi:hypothetical protein